jgi:uncharacterized repeat protein (TIGR01451 family)
VSGRVDTSNSFRSQASKEIAKMTTRAASILIIVLACMLTVAAASASAAPVLRVDSYSSSTAQPGSAFNYTLQVTNPSTEDIGGEVVVTGTLPVGMTALSARAETQEASFEEAGTCTAGDGSTLPGASEIKCTFSAGLQGIHCCSKLFLLVRLNVEFEPGIPEGTILTPEFAASAAGVATATTVDPTRVTATPPGFGFDALDFKIDGADGAPFTQSGGQPEDITVPIDLNTVTAPDPYGPMYPAEPPRDIVAELPPGLVGNPTGLSTCTVAELANSEGLGPRPLCPSSSQVGIAALRTKGSVLIKDYGANGPSSLFNMEPPPGSAARFGFNVFGVVAVLDAHLRPNGDYGLDVGSTNISEGIALAGVSTTFWGRPAAAIHNPERSCPGELPARATGVTCPGGEDVPFLRMPTSCTGPLPLTVHADSWEHPARFDESGLPDLSDPNWTSASTQTHKGPGYPYLPKDWGAPIGTTGCSKVPVKAKLAATPSSLETETPTGLGVQVEVPNQGLVSPGGLSSSDIKDVKVTLPRGVTINPSQAEGLGVCSSAQYESSKLEFNPDGQHGCPSDSKIGTVEVKTPLLEETVPGSVYIAKPYDNPFNSLLAIYIVLEEPQRGILVKLAGEVRTNETTGQIETEFKDLPQLPFSTFDFHFREGARAPLVTPPTCGTYTTEALFTPWSDESRTLESSSSFEIAKGIGGAPCPPGGTPAFKPSFSAGSINNNAGSFSPFIMRLTRQDGEQDMTRFSAVLPPGVLGKLAGVAKCPEAAIAIAKAKSGNQEIASPSCPANSQIGRSTVGAGVGSVLTYVPGKVYLGGPFHGDPLSVIAITPAVAGPFDVGTVVVHEALTLNPKTAEVEVDGAASDPIPHILKGIPAKLRDLRVYVDRQDFILNPTSCDPSQTNATLFGGGGNAFSTLDDVPVSLSDRFQAASCASLGFKPKLALNLKGGTKRGGHPGLSALYVPKEGNANIKALTVRLPRSAFLDQAHIKTICTRVQFAAKSCPKAAQYGYIKAWTPLLEEPLEGPVYLRSSNHKLPDLLFDLHGLVDIEVAVRIDSQKGGIRATLEDSPDAPLSKVVLRMQGGKKGLIVNSRNLCGATSKANVEFTGQNGKQSTATPVMRADCGGKGRKGSHKRR